ncbi:cytosolic sulfotransferase 16 [Ricinus communis]|uniref:Sulfotransferase n=1 Tax=Ricinus communis TaxID=3988 RepID=B9RZH0_RICCO|nr:cytosolic sulfotransferase 16 [Ricinus communis]EEF43350.1 Flavonol 4'-sulfotransferase, putative [Ricinus communis]|eukprot:XP_002519139.1 cytosolic sulfotransferase 16 [Ricinus communis]
MAAASLQSEPTDQRDQEVSQPNINTLKHYNEILPTLPKSKGWWFDHLLQYKGFWLSSDVAIKGLMFLQDHHFISKPDDIVLATYPKCGTTWLRALIFATINRTSYDFATHPLLTSNPQDFVPFLEGYVFQDPSVLENLPLPRLLSTHLPYSLFPESITAATASGSRFVYICRDPKDVLVSKWHFAQKLRPKGHPPFSLQDAFEMFCDGVSHYGPYWDHVLSYWKASLESPRKVLFLKYEDMKREPLVHVKRLAEYLGKPFSTEEQNEGVAEEIIELCSFKKMSNLEVNKSKSSNYLIKNSDFFRKGEIGDWRNNLTPDMAARVDEITKEKLQGTGLSFG